SKAVSTLDMRPGTIQAVRCAIFQSSTVPRWSTSTRAVPEGVKVAAQTSLWSFFRTARAFRAKFSGNKSDLVHINEYPNTNNMYMILYMNSSSSDWAFESKSNRDNRFNLLTQIFVKDGPYYFGLVLRDRGHKLRAIALSYVFFSFNK